MILKNYELNKINIKNNNFILLYGKNEGLKNEKISDLTSKLKHTKIIRYDEKDILDNTNLFMESILTKSLFDNEKVIIIKRASDKLLKVIDELTNKNIEDVIVIVNADSLEKKSKLRIFFEKSKKYFCVAFYPDTNQILSKFTYSYLKEKNITISPINANLIISRCNGDRETLLNELKKIEYYCKNGKKLNFENISKLTNLIENHSVSELIDNCLAKNKKKIIYILNENNFSNEDCILIIRTFLNKSKKILKLCYDFKKNNNIEITISSAKPPIFWKDKEITKQQIYKWNPENIKRLIYELSEIELLVKKNFNNSLNLITDFILSQSISDTSNTI